MERNIRVFETTLGGRPFSVELGRVANLANGSGLIRYGDTAVMATATASSKPREGIDFFPLSVDYEEKMYSVGKIPGGFVKREGRPSEKAVLNARLIDRPMRPMFPDGFFNEVQLIIAVLSVEQDNAPEAIAITAASIAIAVSDIPFEATVAGVVVGFVDGEYVINPTVEQMERSRLNLTVAGTEEAIVMVEAGADILTEEEILEGIMYGHEAIKELVKFIDGIKAEVGKEKMIVPEVVVDEALKTKVYDFAYDRMNEAIRVLGKKERNAAVDTIKTELLEHLAEDYPERDKEIGGFFKKIEKETVRKMIIHEGQRPDGRAHDEVRPIACETSLLARTHGSALFSRGVTQALTITSLGALSEAQRIDGLGIEETKRYMHHYNFPPYSTGEARPMRGPKRREIGHGALAEKAIVPVLPTEEEFPYSIRVVSEVLESNGSSSMASVCGSSLSLMDAGVPIKRPVAGIALGLVQEDDKHVILSDIQGLEDFNGDMDFKVAGTENGITAIQLDIKITGLSLDKFAEALERARLGRLHILGVMNKEISEPKSDLSKYAPRMFVTNIPVDKIKVLIGSGGKTINKIIDETGVQIDIQEDGTVYVSAESTEAGHSALELISQITKDVEVGEIYDGKVNRIEKYGAFIELLPGKDGLLHISEMDVKRVNKTEDIVSLGDIIQVKVINIDDSGKIKLSRKQLLLEKQKESNE